MFNRRISSWATTVAVVAATACHHTPSKSLIITADRLGVYQFSEHVVAGGDAGETIDIEGQAELLGDSVLIDARPGPCRVSPPKSPNAFVYLCGTVTLSFDRRDPILHSSYAVTLSRNATQQVCARYTTDANGRLSVCAEYRTATIPSSVRRSGSLHLTRVPD